MALPSLADVVLVVTFLFPGFLSLALFRRIAILERKISELEVIVWSLVISILIYTAFSFYSGIRDIDEMRDKILFSENLLAVLGLSLGFGIFPGLLVKYTWRRSVYIGSCWTRTLFERAPKVAIEKGAPIYVLVYTQNGLEYKGELHYAGGKESPKEIAIRKPKLILRNKNWKVLREIKRGKEILFTEKDIQRVVFFERV